MNTSTLDPLIHHPARLPIAATLATLPDGDALVVTRLQDMLGLLPGTLITRLRELDRAGYVRTATTRGENALVTAALTCVGRAALERYTAVLQQLFPMTGEDHQAPAPWMRVGDADREAAAAALGEHFAQGRLTLDELTARLEATLTATTHGQLSRATRDLPDMAALSARASGRQGFASRTGLVDVFLITFRGLCPVHRGRTAEGLLFLADEECPLIGGVVGKVVDAAGAAVGHRAT